MKRRGNLYQTMISRERMDMVFSGVMKDKDGKSDPNSFTFMVMQNPEYYKADCADILNRRAFKPKKPRESIRYDAGSNKERHIQAPALYPDQFVHWSIVLALEEIFMQGMDLWCCASVKGRGVLYAKKYIEGLLDNSMNDIKNKRDYPENKYKYCLKMDIRKYFQNIDRDILMQKLESKIKDQEMLYLCRQVIYSVPGTGLPLGYYTSQWFANFYLQSFDHYLREVLMPKYGVHVYVRYMDDMIILGSNMRKLQRMMAEIDEYLRRTLHVFLKDTSCVFAIKDRDIDFVGFRFSYGKTTLRKRVLVAARKSNERLYGNKYTLSNALSAMAYNGFMVHSDTKTYRKEHFTGSVYSDRKIVSELCKEDLARYYQSKEFEKLINLKEDMNKLREETELGDGVVLIRYYPNRDQIKVVARTRFVFPDQAEYDAKKAAEEEAKANKPKKKRKKKHAHKPGTPYRANAEVQNVIDPAERQRIRRDYNLEIRQHAEAELIHAMRN